MIDEILGPLLKKRMGNAVSITIELNPGEKQKQNEENEKMDMAPIIEDKEESVGNSSLADKKLGGQEEMMMDQESMENGDEDPLKAILGPGDEEEFLKRDEIGLKPKGVYGKAMQSKVVAKNKKDDKALV